MNVDQNADRQLVYLGLALVAATFASAAVDISMLAVLVLLACLGYAVFLYDVMTDAELNARRREIKEQLPRRTVWLYRLSLVLLAVGTVGLVGYPYAVRAANIAAVGGVLLSICVFMFTRKRLADEELRTDPTVTEFRTTRWYTSKKLAAVLGLLAVGYLVVVQVTPYAAPELRGIGLLFGLLAVGLGTMVLLARTAYRSVA